MLNVKQHLHTAAVLNRHLLKGPMFKHHHGQCTIHVIIWGHCTEWKTIFKLQKKMVRVMMNVPYRESCKPLSKKLNILTFPNLYLY